MATGSDPTWDPQKFPKFLFLFYNIYKLISYESHSFLSLFNVKRLVIGEKVRFQPIVYTNFGKSFQYSYFVKEISICYHMGCIYNK